MMCMDPFSPLIDDEGQGDPISGFHSAKVAYTWTKGTAFGCCITLVCLFPETMHPLLF